MKKSSLTKIAFIVDYYSPFTPGGSEWSVYYLAEQLKQNKVESIIITPNYGAKNEEIIDGIKVIRFPIFKKPKDNRSVINPIWQNNPLFFLWSAFWIAKICFENSCSNYLPVHMIERIFALERTLRAPLKKELYFRFS